MMSQENLYKIERGAEKQPVELSTAEGKAAQEPAYSLTEETKLFPKMVVINTCYPCNAFCPHCPYTPTNSKIRMEARAREFPYMPWDVFKAIADEVGKNKAILRFSGAGEPLVHKQCVDYIEYAKSVGCQVGLINNGSLMTEDRARRMLEAKVEMIEFSVDAADPETYDIVRKGLKFEKTLANIKKTVELRNALKTKTRIIASVVDQKIVHHMMDDIVAFWKPIVDVVQVRKYLTWDVNDLNNSGDVTPYLDPEAACPFPFDRLLIDSNGDMRFCVYDIKARTNWGNVLKETISSVWTGPDFDQLRRFHNDREFNRMEICEKCLDRQFRSWDYNYFLLREKAQQALQEKIAN
jgi:MoaA/NifB/PqqE/SkfB family radical SAM enzyme